MTPAEMAKFLDAGPMTATELRGLDLQEAWLLHPTPGSKMRYLAWLAVAGFLDLTKRMKEIDHGR